LTSIILIANMTAIKLQNKLKRFKRSWEWCVLNQILRLKMAPGMTETTKL
jgi:hypothetical protein